MFVSHLASTVLLAVKRQSQRRFLGRAVAVHVELRQHLRGGLSPLAHRLAAVAAGARRRSGRLRSLSCQFRIRAPRRATALSARRLPTRPRVAPTPSRCGRRPARERRSRRRAVDPRRGRSREPLQRIAMAGGSWRRASPSTARTARAARSSRRTVPPRRYTGRARRRSLVRIGPGRRPQTAVQGRDLQSRLQPPLSAASAHRVLRGGSLSAEPTCSG